MFVFSFCGCVSGNEISFALLMKGVCFVAAECGCIRLCSVSNQVKVQVLKLGFLFPFRQIVNRSFPSLSLSLALSLRLLYLLSLLLLLKRVCVCVCVYIFDNFYRLIANACTDVLVLVWCLLSLLLMLYDCVVLWHVSYTLPGPRPDPTRPIYTT